ncbi:MAG: HU family DNA-binding protein [Alphaproteobacteria bacterium]|nr:HU family DNA-binding protein [Alphaproteobacteria bacterium]
MNRKELTARLAARTGLSRAQAADAVRALFDTIDSEGILPQSLAAGERVVLSGFGTFSTRVVAPRQVTLPSGDVVDVPERRQVVFRPGQTLRRQLREGS